jgi:galactan endo-1,6-beta-galactosidase
MNGSIFALLSLASLTHPAMPDYSIVVNKSDLRGTWEGWGCSICWWGKGVGSSAYQDKYADVLFTQKTISLLDQNVPGLGLSIARYNVGGGGNGDIIDGAKENVPSTLPWFKDIDGYWVNWFKAAPSSSSFDWFRDSNQRNVLWAARDRGAAIEFFANAPMWWMTAEKSSAGGQLQSWNRQDYAKYLATVVRYAQDHWGVTVGSISPFNEPSAGWWKYPKDQEGCNIGREVQAEILGYLRQELNLRGVSAVQIAASDENAMTEATATYEYFKNQTVPIGTRRANVAGLINRINVHGYSGLELWRDNAARTALRASAGSKRIWMSEVGDGEGGGLPLAQSITEDINFLRPSAWVYWQPIEPFSGWGLINAKYADAADQTAADRAKPTWIYQKYFTFAQFTRFLRPGYQLIGTNDHKTICAYDAAGKKLVVITLNYGNAQTIQVDLSGFSAVGTAGTVTVTNTDGPKRLVESPVTVTQKKFSISAEANSVYSTVISGVTR